ncbi:hypothetical protein IW262DRAFT_1292285 [Armillaria fumosa]|nr:hypothetical protein IW262DRAFT_1292285 [Armillaria fumosa]
MTEDGQDFSGGDMLQLQMIHTCIFAIYWSATQYQYFTNFDLVGHYCTYCKVYSILMPGRHQMPQNTQDELVAMLCIIFHILQPTLVVLGEQQLINSCVGAFIWGYLNRLYLELPINFHIEGWDALVSHSPAKVHPSHDYLLQQASLDILGPPFLAPKENIAFPSMIFTQFLTPVSDKEDDDKAKRHLMSVAGTLSEPKVVPLAPEPNFPPPPVPEMPAPSVPPKLCTPLPILPMVPTVEQMPTMPKMMSKTVCMSTPTHVSTFPPPRPSTSYFNDFLSFSPPQLNPTSIIWLPVPPHQASPLPPIGGQRDFNPTPIPMAPYEALVPEASVPEDSKVTPMFVNEQEPPLPPRIYHALSREPLDLAELPTLSLSHAPPTPPVKVAGIKPKPWMLLKDCSYFCCLSRAHSEPFQVATLPPPPNVKSKEVHVTKKPKFSSFTERPKKSSKTTPSHQCKKACFMAKASGSGLNSKTGSVSIIRDTMHAKLKALTFNDLQATPNEFLQPICYTGKNGTFGTHSSVNPWFTCTSDISAGQRRVKVELYEMVYIANIILIELIY